MWAGGAQALGSPSCHYLQQRVWLRRLRLCASATAHPRRIAPTVCAPPLLPTQVHPRGVQLELAAAGAAATAPPLVDTLVMSNLGYFQLKAAPGLWTLRLAPGEAAACLAGGHCSGGLAGLLGG